MQIITIPTTTWTEQSFCLSSEDSAFSSREMIQVFSGKEITVARPGKYYHDVDDDVNDDDNNSSHNFNFSFLSFFKLFGLLSIFAWYFF